MGESVQGQAPESRQGRAWSEAEDARLVDGVRAGLTLQELSERHGRSTGAIRARVTRFVPQSGPTDDEALEWLRAQLAADPAYSWQRVLDERRHRERRERGHRVPASGTPVSSDAVVEVLADWQQVTGHVLRPERREIFVARQVVIDLATVAAPVRQAAARRLWQEATQLLLVDWLLECLCPGAVGLTADWTLIAERDADTVLVLRELAAVAVGEIPVGTCQRDQGG